jgi:hypothetical protein
VRSNIAVVEILDQTQHEWSAGWECPCTLCHLRHVELGPRDQISRTSSLVAELELCYEAFLTPSSALLRSRPQADRL